MRLAADDSSKIIYLHLKQGLPLTFDQTPINFDLPLSSYIKYPAALPSGDGFYLCIQGTINSLSQFDMRVHLSAGCHETVTNSTDMISGKLLLLACMLAVQGRKQKVVCELNRKSWDVSLLVSR